MPSLFPGMSPYFEQPGVWRGFYTRFLVHLQEAITPRVVPRYLVGIEESLYLEHPEDEAHLFAVGDLAVAESSGAVSEGSTSASIAAPVTATALLSRPIRRRRRWLSIRDTRDRKIVTVIELLSPSDKRPGKDRDRYLEKRNRVLCSRANLVEIDLLRMPVRGQTPPCDYLFLLARRPERPRVGLWPFGVRDPFPPLVIPLLPGEVEPSIDLKPVVDQVYDGGGYAYQLYSKQPDPPLSADDAEWARPLLAGAAPLPA